MSSNHVDFTGLRKWFTPKDIRSFFGARSQNEVNEAVDFFGRLKADDVVAMKQIMAKTMGQYIAGERR